MRWILLCGYIFIDLGRYFETATLCAQFVKFLLYNRSDIFKSSCSRVLLIEQISTYSLPLTIHTFFFSAEVKKCKPRKFKAPEENESLIYVIPAYFIKYFLSLVFALIITLSIFHLFCYKFLFIKITLCKIVLDWIPWSVYFYSKWKKDFKDQIYVIKLKNFGRQFLQKLQMEIRWVIQEKN